MSDETARISPWDVFMHLLALIALYVSVFALIDLAIELIKLAIPDRLDDTISIHSQIRFSVALLIVFFPAYIWSWRAIETDLSQNPDKQRNWLRTCPIYLTLFIAGLIALIDTSCLVYYFLIGELPSRFLAQLIVIFMVCGAVFFFYLESLRRDPRAPSVLARGFAYSAILVVFAVVVTGLGEAGSPARARFADQDMTRIQNLSEIQSRIIVYWQHKGALPSGLGVLVDNVSNFTLPSDPASGASYVYRKTGTTSFELCADFALEDLSAGSVAHGWFGDNGGPDTAWTHKAGNFCFSRTIDPAMYPRLTTSPPAQ